MRAGQQLNIEEQSGRRKEGRLADSMENSVMGGWRNYNVDTTDIYHTVAAVLQLRSLDIEERRGRRS